ncbi:MAG: sulfurtransferase [Chloroflexi bacterium]|nr:sulfurtransferase [Chloroflexota bacterium]
MAGLLVSVEELRRVGAGDARVVDVRWKLGDPSAGRALFEAGHIPGAVYVDMDQDLAAEPGPGGRHPLPEARQFEQAMGRVGIGNATRVIAYDDGGAGAPRLWWLLRHFGHDNVSILDGGYPAWLAAGGPTEAGNGSQPPVAEFHAKPREGDFVEVDQLQAALHEGAVHLLDARAPERWRGDVEPVDKVAGRIPGSLNAPSADNLKDGHFRSAEELRQQYARLGVLDGKPIVVSCGSGVSACVDLVGLELAGIKGAQLYPGSFSGWIARGLPVARGSASD